MQAIATGERSDSISTCSPHGSGTSSSGRRLITVWRRCRSGWSALSTGAAAALVAAARHAGRVDAVVSPGGRSDLAGSELSRVQAAVLMIVGSGDPQAIELNRGASKVLRCEWRLEIVPGATHLFDEPGALDRVRRSCCRLADSPSACVLCGCEMKRAIGARLVDELQFTDKAERKNLPGRSKMGRARLARALGHEDDPTTSAAACSSVVKPCVSRALSRKYVVLCCRCARDPVRVIRVNTFARE